MDIYWLTINLKVPTRYLKGDVSGIIPKVKKLVSKFTSKKVEIAIILDPYLDKDFIVVDTDLRLSKEGKKFIRSWFKDNMQELYEDIESTIK